MNVEIGTEAAQFPRKDYMIGIFVAVHARLLIKNDVLRRVSDHGVGRGAAGGGEQSQVPGGV
jgi:hypothetical protein